MQCGSETETWVGFFFPLNREKEACMKANDVLFKNGNRNIK
jgi:hypothetical protein